MSIPVPTVVVLTASIITIPLYIVLIVFIFYNRYKRKEYYASPFYILIISQGALDIFSMLNFILFTFGRSVPFLMVMYWQFRDSYLPSWCYTYIYATLYMRVVGVVLITLQRFLSICFPMATVNQIIARSPFPLVVCVHYSLGLLLSIPIFFQHATFDGVETMAVTVDRLPLGQNTLQAAITTFSAAVLCAFCYICIITCIAKFNVNNVSTTKQKAFRSETKLAIQAGGLFIAFTLITVHYVTMYSTSYWNASESFRDLLRSWYTIWSALLSYVSPYMLLLLNSDIRSRFACRQQPTSSRVTSIRAISVTAAWQNVSG